MDFRDYLTELVDRGVGRIDLEIVRLDRHYGTKRIREIEDQFVREGVLGRIDEIVIRGMSRDGNPRAIRVENLVSIMDQAREIVEIGEEVGLSRSSKERI